MQVTDVIHLFMAKESTLKQCGLNGFHDLEAFTTEKHINGVKLAKATIHAAVRQLLFGDEHKICDRQKQDTITSEIIKVIEFQVLRKKVQNDIILKFDLCKEIARKRLLYYSEGGRETLSQHRSIVIESPLDEFEQIKEQ